MSHAVIARSPCSEHKKPIARQGSDESNGNDGPASQSNQNRKVPSPLDVGLLKERPDVKSEK